jgi:glycosyltransferase involved in cell wall biosynthesis
MNFDRASMVGKKVLFLHHGIGASGAEISLLYLMYGLKKRGMECIVACTKERGNAIAFFQAEGFKAIQCKAAFFPHTTGGWHPLWKYSGIRWLIGWRLQYMPACRRIAQVLHQIKPDIVHLNSLTLAPYLPLISSYNLPTVLHVRERVQPGTFGVRKKWLKNIVLQHASAVIYICRDNRDHFMGEHPIGRVVDEPVDFNTFNKDLDQKQARKMLGLADETKIILFLGGSGLRIKGIMPLLKALSILKKKMPHFTCIMLGTHKTPSSSFLPTLLRKCANLCGIYSERQQIERSIFRYGLEDHVISLPFVRNVQEYYAATDVVVAPSIEPHFARQVIEAGAMAKPVIASRIGGIEEVVADGETGILVPPGDTSALADGLAEILANSEMGKSMGESAYLIARKRYHADVSTEQVCDIYASLI